MNNKTVVTEKGTTLPLINLKGKSYLMVAHRLQWFNEQVTNYSITTEFIERTDSSATAKATIIVYNNLGQFIKSAQGTKTENKVGFGDFLEKAETGAIGRALALLGYGTQYALSDLDEGTRIVDAPVEDVKPKPVLAEKVTFRKPTIVVAPVTTQSAQGAVIEDLAIEGWE